MSANDFYIVHVILNMLCSVLNIIIILFSPGVMEDTTVETTPMKTRV